MICLIVARSRNNVIGKDGTMPWHIPGELSQFLSLTTGNTVIMGRRTYEAIGHPLKDRTNIIVSSSLQINQKDCFTVSSLQQAIEKSPAGKDIYIAGGAQLYKEAIPIVDVMYITEVDVLIEDGDTFFPSFDPDNFKKEILGTEGDTIRYTRTVYTRKENLTYGSK